MPVALIVPSPPLLEVTLVLRYMHKIILPLNKLRCKRVKEWSCKEHYWLDPQQCEAVHVTVLSSSVTCLACHHCLTSWKSAEMLLTSPLGTCSIASNHYYLATHANSACCKAKQKLYKALSQVMHWGSQEAPKKAHNENAEEDLRQQLLRCK